MIVHVIGINQHTFQKLGKWYVQIQTGISRGGEGWGFPGVQHVTFQSRWNHFSR